MIWEIDDGEKQIEGLDASGRPDPAYAASLGLLPAPFGRRTLATLAELVILLLIALPGVAFATPALVAIASGADAAKMLADGELIWPIVAVAAANLLVTVFTVVQLVLHGRKGVTAGKAMFGLRSVNVRTLERPGFWRGAVVRYLLLSVSFLLPVLGPLLVVALSPFFDAERRGRGWLDQAGAIWMVDARKGLNPYDAKRMRIARKSVKTPEHERHEPLPSLATPLSRDAPAQYTPSGRLSGGVIGAHRGSAAAEKPVAPRSAPAPAAAAVPLASAGMVDAVPPLLGAASAVSPAASAPAVPPASAPAAPAAPSASAPVAPAVPSVSAAITPPLLDAPAAPHAPSSPAARATASAASAPEPAGPAAGGQSAVRAVLLLDDGTRVEVRGATLIGRAPAPVSGEGAVQLVPVADTTLSVSKTHLAVLPSRRAVLVVDRGSTNGSAIVRGGAETALTPGDPAPVQAGDVVRFGDRSLTVERA